MIKIKILNTYLWTGYTMNIENINMKKRDFLIYCLEKETRSKQAITATKIHASVGY